MKKKIFATLLAAVMTLASTMTAFAADVPTSFSEITYKFDCTTFVAEDTITISAAESVCWAGFESGNTYTVTGTGAFEVTCVFKTDQGTWTLEPVGFKNMGYLSSANNVANIYKLTGFVIEGVEFTFATTYDALNAADSAANGWANIWGGYTDGQVVASSAKGSKVVFSDDAAVENDEALKVVWAEADFAEPETTTQAPTTTAGNDGASTSANIDNNQNPTGDATNYSVAIAMIALAAAGVVFFNKKIVTEK